MTSASVSQWNRWTEIPLIARGLSGVSGCWPVGIASAMLPFVNVRKLVSLRYYRAVASALVYTWARLYRRDPATRPPEQTSLPATTDEDWRTKGCEFCSLRGFGDDAMLCNHAVVRFDTKSCPGRVPAGRVTSVLNSQCSVTATELLVLLQSDVTF